MAQLMQTVGPLKVEIRLQQALDGFSSNLKPDHKKEFLSDQANYQKRLPNTNDVMILMGQLNSKASRSNFGPRVQSVLQVTQQFAAVGDVLIGGSQSLIACGVWTAVRFTLQAAVTSRKLMDKISEIFMTAGRSTPRYEALARLYDHKSTRLRNYFYEYFLTLVNMCNYLVKFLDKHAVSRAISSLSDTECNAFQSQLSEWSSQIKDEALFLMAQGIEEQRRSWLENVKALSKMDSARKLAKARTRILDACSTYPYESSWKRIRKKGNTALFTEIYEYRTWKSKGSDDGEFPSTLVLTGGLGSGKSVLAANMVEDLGLVAHSNQSLVLYFFCEYETIKSTIPNTIIGSIARQLLQSIDFVPPQDTSKYKVPLTDTDDITALLRKVVPQGQKAYCVIDGLYECADDDVEDILETLGMIQAILKLHICLTYRLETTTKDTLHDVGLRNLGIVDIPDNSEVLETFIGDELERCIESDRLKLGDATLVEEILTTLTAEAQGMFLWAELQISELCWASSDKEIRKTLQSLPKTLAETFERLLERAATHGTTGQENQRKILSHMIVAARSLTKDELGDLLGVTRFEVTWSPDQVCTNVDNLLSTCGSLITVDEETMAIRFVHSSARKFILERKASGGKTNDLFEASNKEMADLIVTYLNYNVLQTYVARFVSPTSHMFEAGSTPAKIIQSSIGSDTVKSLSLRLLRSKKKKNAGSVDLAPVMNHDQRPVSPANNDVRDKHPFFAYASEFWAHHAASSNQTEATETYSVLLSKTIRKHLNKRDHRWEMRQLLPWAEEKAPDILVMLFDWFFDEPQLTGLAQTWVRNRLDLDQDYFTYQFAPGEIVHSNQQYKVNDHLELLAGIAATRGHQLVLDLLLYRALNVKMISMDFMDLLVKCVMMAIYSDEHKVVGYILCGLYREMLAKNRDERQVQFQPILWQYEEHMERLCIWTALFGSDRLIEYMKTLSVGSLQWFGATSREMMIRERVTNGVYAEADKLFGRKPFGVSFVNNGKWLRIYSAINEDQYEEILKAANAIALSKISDIEQQLGALT